MCCCFFLGGSGGGSPFDGNRTSQQPSLNPAPAYSQLLPKGGVLARPSFRQYLLVLVQLVPYDKKTIDYYRLDHFSLPTQE